MCNLCYARAWSTFASELHLNGLKDINTVKVEWTKYILGQDVPVNGYLVKYQPIKGADLILQIMKFSNDGYWVDMVGLIIDVESIKEYVALEQLL